MPMTAGQRTFTALSMGVLFLSTPGQASLEKIKIVPPHIQQVPVRPPRVVKLTSRMIASWYGDEFQGRLTASGETFDPNDLTAAHKTLPLGSRVRLRAISTGHSVIVRINDRGPWIKGRDLDLSEAAAVALGIHDHGIAAVEATLMKNGAMGVAAAAPR